MDSGGALSAIACPATSQCTAVDAQGREVTFNPNEPGSPTATAVDTGGRLGSISCPTTSQCTAADVALGSGKEVTFNPGSPGGAVVATVDTSSDALAPLLAAVSCPSPSRRRRRQPRRGDHVRSAAPGSATSARVDDNALDAGGGGLTDVSCFSTSQCVAVDGATGAVVFNPASPGSTSSIFFNVLGGAGNRASRAPRRQRASWSMRVEMDTSLTPRLRALPLRCHSIRKETSRASASRVPRGPAACSSMLTAARLRSTERPDARSRPDRCDREPRRHRVSEHDPVHRGRRRRQRSHVRSALARLAGPARDCGRRDAAERRVPVDLGMRSTYAGTGTTHEITFDPVSPGTPRAVKIDSEAGQAGSAPYVACPTTSQCTAMSSFRDYTDWDTSTRPRLRP